MKRITFLLALMCAFIFNVSAEQPTGTEIHRIISANRGANLMNAGVVDPNLIFPGQELSYKFEDGHYETVIVQPGDTQWSIVERILSLEKKHGKVVPETKVTETEQPVPVKEDEAQSSASWPWWVWLVLGGILAFILMKATRRTNKNENTEEELQPMVSEPVEDAQAPGYMLGVAQRTMGNRVRLVGPTEKGTLTTVRPIQMSYYGGASRMETFENEPFYRALAELPNGNQQHAYFRQICGNDATILNPEDVQFTPEAVQSPELQTANQALGQQIQTSQTPGYDKFLDFTKTALEGRHPAQVSLVVENGKALLDIHFFQPANAMLPPITSQGNNHVKKEPANQVEMS